MVRKHSKKKCTYFNSLSFARWVVVKIPFKGCRYDDDELFESIPVQEYEGETYAELWLPPCGWVTIVEDEPCSGEPGEGVKVTKTTMRNMFKEFKFNKLGELVSARDLEFDAEMMAGSATVSACTRTCPAADAVGYRQHVQADADGTGAEG